jgi:hypothetical protein
MRALMPLMFQVAIFITRYLVMPGLDPGIQLAQSSKSIK